jgi:hypothetical protein
MHFKFPPVTLLILQNASPHVITVLAGNKCESADRIVDSDSGHKVNM